MNLTDLTEVLRRHAELPPDAAHGPRMSGIRAKVKASRRRRATAVAASIVAVLGVAFALTAPVQRESQPAEPEPVVFSEYHEGTRIVAQTSGRAPASTIALRFVPTTPEPELFITCDPHDDSKQMYSTLIVNGVPVGDGLTCGLPMKLNLDWTKHRIGVGAPMTVTMSVGEQLWDEEEQGAHAGPMPPDATFAAAVGVPVAPEDYPFPPRPETLAPIDPALDATNPGQDRVFELRAVPGRSNGTWQTAVSLPSRPVYVVVAVNTPGRIRVLINDVEVVEHATWTYRISHLSDSDQGYWEVGVEPGATVNITVIAERTSGDWAVLLKET
ncbi:hypothetical protein [Saccharothrix luteola]|uniref:hypothetical protein n=1 Tax=Saccharothrix luteola TaxID=2893018 RepID=UPI001E328FD1|nr:hypothetical protein [Saccharothrix luteola]MCC8246837.1 hypothetical protein [Saccharothrix luteola]